MANQTNKATQNNPSQDTGFGQGSSAQPARDINAPGTSGTENTAPTRNPGLSTGAPGTGSTGTPTTLDKAKDTAKNLLDQAKSTAGDAYESVAEKASSTLEEHKAGLSGGIASVADSVRRVGGTLNQTPQPNTVTEYSAHYADTAAVKLEQIAQYFERTDLRGIVRDVETYARRNPALFLGSAFAIGVLAARFIKSSPPPSIGNFSTDVDRQLTAGTEDRGLGTTPPGAI